ncbi:hypothetical protein [Pedobacter psychrodurus]|uniref:hypothetical protein n=1 Tax=Pedobacter psychrodurus TaxID=2530456 RepID=UPI00292FBB8E|nr:hypothetical protein [Pedobacter psychrodurus]
MVKALTAEEKQRLVNILIEENQFVVQEAEVVYLKKTKTFDEKWAESISVEEFEKAVHENIQKLPWK